MKGRGRCASCPYSNAGLAIQQGLKISLHEHFKVQLQKVGIEHEDLETDVLSEEVLASTHERAAGGLQPVIGKASTEQDRLKPTVLVNGMPLEETGSTC